MSDVVVRFSALPEHIRTARLVAAAVGRKSGLEEHILDEVRIAVGEACSRAVSAHLARCPDAPIEMRLRDADGMFEATISDEVPSEETEDLNGATEGFSRDTEEPRSQIVEPGTQTEEPSHQTEELGPATEEPAPTTHDPSPANLEIFGYVGSGQHAVPRQLPPGVGLAVVSALAREVDVSTSPDGVRVRMSWPTAQ